MSRGFDADAYNGFNFGAGDPLPHLVPAAGASIRGSQSFRSFYRDADARTYAYLRDRNVSISFLKEIDLFLSTNSNLARHCPDWTEVINQPDVLAAYLHFSKGYTRPARYIEGIIPSFHDVRLPVTLPRMADRYDPELEAWFDGTPYRTDLLQVMDEEVDRVAAKLWRREHVTFPERKFLAYCVWGNLVDAFKYFEYNYQTSWLPHRYLPEHVMLLKVPKPPKYCEPTPRTILGRYDPRVSVSFRTVRFNMARAHDAGVDVLDVLMENFTSALCRQKLRRPEINRLRNDALQLLDDERLQRRERDIVDLIMGLTVNAGSANRSTRMPPRRTRKHGRRHGIAEQPTRGQGHDRTLDQLEQALRRMPQWEARRDSGLATVDLDTVRLRRMQKQKREWVSLAFAVVQQRGLVKRSTAQECRALFTPKAFLNSNHDQQRDDILQELKCFLQM